MRRSDIIQAINEEIDQIFTGYLSICDNSVAELILTRLEELGMEPPKVYSNLQAGDDCSLTLYENKWEDELILPIGEMNTPLENKKG